MAEKMSVTVRVYDQETDDIGSNNLIELCVEDDTYILDAEQVRRAIDNAVNVWVPRKEGYYRNLF